MLLKKLTVKTVCGEFPFPTPEKPKIKLATIGGIVTGAGVKTTDYGDSWRLSGQFLAFNVLTGERFESSVSYLPDVVSEPLAAAVRATNQPVEFAVEVGVQFDRSVATRYTYYAETVREISQAPALAGIEREMLERMGKTPQLPAPAAAPEKPAQDAPAEGEKVNTAKRRR